MTVFLWSGVINPARLLSYDEIEVLGERCAVCHGTAHVVEARRTLTPEEQQQPLEDFDLTDLRFTCGLHAPLDVPEETFNAIDLEFYEAMREPVTCPDKGWQKHISNCLRTLPRCVRRCEPIRGRLAAISLEQARGMIVRGEALYRRRERRRKEEEDANTT